MPTRRRSSSASRPWWSRLTDEQLLEVRLCDLDVHIAGTDLEARIAQLYQELADRGIRYRPKCWLSDEWFAPDHTPGVAIPFYVAHPRLAKLEDRMMFEVEGGTRSWCMQLLRHETGHAIETAYRLPRRQRWRNHFGDPSKPYPEYYRPKPFSRSYVHHLDWWYAQSHPTEDFAETFAVWLNPGSQWRKRYREWPALRKLEYVDELMTELRGRAPAARTRRVVDPLSTMTHTLGDHYEARHERRQTDYPDFYDRDLRRLFPGGAGAAKAASFLRKVSPRIRTLVASWTGEYPYTINLALRDMISRCRELDLRVEGARDDVVLSLAVLVTMYTMNYVYSTDHLIAV